MSQTTPTGDASDPEIPVTEGVPENGTSDQAALEAAAQRFESEAPPDEEEPPPDPAELRELALQLESTLRAFEDRPDLGADALRLRLVTLYKEQLDDGEQAFVHLDPLLRRDAIEEAALDAGEMLLMQRSLAPRVAPLLSDAYARLGRNSEESGPLALELMLSEEPRLSYVRKRLGVLRQEVLEDPEGALELFEQVVQAEPGDDEIRRRFIELSRAQERAREAATLLSAALSRAEDQAIKARLGLDVGRLLFVIGDQDQARIAFELALSAETRDDAVLLSARELCAFNSGAANALVRALSVLATREPVREARHKAAQALLELGTRQKLDPAVEIAAWQALLDSQRELEALARLEALCDAAGDDAILAEVLERRAELASDPAAATRFALRSAEALARIAKSQDAQIDIWHAFFARHGTNAKERSDLFVSADLSEAARRGLRRSILREAEMAPDPAVRIALLSEAAGFIEEEPEADEQAIEIAMMGLLHAALQMPEVLPEWLARVFRYSARMPPEPRAALFARAIAVAGDSVERLPLLLAAARAFTDADDEPRASDAYARALAQDPGSPEIIAAIDALRARAGEPVTERIDRYRRALDEARDPVRRADLACALGRLERDAKGDVAAAIASFQAIASEQPGHAGLHAALVEIFAEQPDEAALSAELERGRASVGDRERASAVLGVARGLIDRDSDGPGLDLIKRLLEDPKLDGAALDAIAALAESQDDVALLRRVFETRIKLSAEGPLRVNAYERLGEFLAERLGDGQAAAEAWKAAAKEAESSDDRGAESRRLYERALESAGDDPEAAEALIKSYADANDWTQITGVYSVLLRQADVPEKLKRSVDLLLMLAERAAAGRAGIEYAALVDEVLWRLGSDDAEKIRALMAGKARVLAADPARAEQAAEAYRALIEAQANAEDVAEFRGFVERQPAAEFCREELSWLFEWRAAKAEQPTPILIEWARTEESRFGDPGTAAAICERALGQDRDNLEALEYLAQLRLRSGDWEGREDCLERLSSRVEESRRLDIDLERASILIEKLGRAGEALPVLEGVLKTLPENFRARELVRGLLSLPDAELRARAAIQFVRASADDAPAPLARVLDQALTATTGIETLGDDEETSAFERERRSWYQRAIALATDPRAAFELAQRAALESPTSEPLWAAMSAQAVALGQPALAVGVYQRALERAKDREEIDELGRRLVSFADTQSVDVGTTTAALISLLGAAPGARWALDRVKLSLHAQARYADLFQLYDRAIDATEDEAERADLLNEASVAAKDLAADIDRALGYLERLLELRGEDARVDTLLERLYERHGRTPRLIEHLERRLPRLTDSELADLRERIVTLRLDSGEAPSALPMVEAMLAENPDSEEALALLERLFQAAPARAAIEGETSSAERAGEILRERYADLGRPSEIARLLGEELAFVTLRERRMALLEKLANVNEVELGDQQAALSAVGELVLLSPGDSERRGRLATLAELLGVYHQQVDFLLRAAESEANVELRSSLLREAARVSEGPLAKPDRAAGLYELLLSVCGDQPELTLETLHALSALWLSLRRSDKRADVLERIATLEQGPARAQALTDAARTAALELGDPGRAANSWAALVSENPENLEALDGLVAALQACGRFADLAEALKLRIQRGEDVSAIRRDKKVLARLCAERLADPGAAIGLWQELYEADRNDAEALDSLAALLESEGRFGELIALYEGAIAGTSTPQSLYVRLSEVHRKHTGNTKAAVVALLAAGDLSGATHLIQEGNKLDDPPLRVELGSALLAAAKADDAVRVLRTQIDQYGDRRPKERAVVHSLLADAHLLGERPPVALAEMKEAAAVDPSNPHVLYKLGELALEQSDFDVADQSFRALLLVALHSDDAHEKQPRRSEIYYRLSEIAERRWDENRAQELLSSALDTAVESDDEAAGLERAVCRTGKDELLLAVLELRQKQASGPTAAGTALLELVEARAQRGPLSDALAARARERAAELRAELTKAKHKKLGLEAWRPLLEVERRLGGPESVLELLSFLGKRFAKSDIGPELLLEAGRLMLELPERRAEAIEILEEARERDPERDDIAKLLALAFEAEGRTEQALAAYEAIAARPNAEQKPALEAVARLLEATKAPPKRLIGVLEQWLSLEQGAKAADIAERLYTLESAAGDSAAALAALQAGLSADPGRRTLALRYAEICSEAGESERALGVLEQALGASPGDLELERRQAQALEAAGRHAEALDALERIHDKDGIDAAELLAAIERSGLGANKRWAMREVALLTEAGKRERARERLNEWLGRNAEDVEALRELARLCSAERAWGEAVEAYERLLRLETGPTAVDSAIKFAEACERAGQGARALPELERASRISPRHPALKKQLRRIYTESQQHEKLAKLLIEDAQNEATPAARAELLERAGQSLLEMGLAEQALGPLEQARALAPDKASFALGLARALSQVGRSADAVSCLTEVAKAHKSARDPEHMRVHEEIARIHLEADELGEAYEALTVAHRLDRGNLKIALMLGLVAFDLDELTVSGNALRIVIVASRGEGGLGPAERSSAYYYLGVLQYFKGSDANARQMAHKAVEEDPLNLDAQKLLEMAEAHLR